jgi:hypothetical protein
MTISNELCCDTVIVLIRCQNLIKYMKYKNSALLFFIKRQHKALLFPTSTNALTVLAALIE